MRRLSVALPLVIMWMWVAAAPSWAQPVPDGPEFQVNTYTTGYQFEAAVSMDGSGNFVVVWASYEQDGDYGGIFGQRYDSTGSMQGPEFPINTFTTGGQQRPDVSMDSSGNFVVVWTDLGQDGSDAGVFGQRFNNAGMQQGGEFQVNTFTLYSQQAPAVSMDNFGGGFVVVWTSTQQDGSGQGIFGQRFDSAGAMLKNEFQVNTYTNFSQFGPSVAHDGAGNFMVVWDSYFQDGSGAGVFGQRFNNAGKLQGPEFLVNTFTMNGQRFPAVSMEASGNFVVAWQSNDQDGDLRGIFAQRFDSMGATLGGEFPVNTSTTDDQITAKVSMDGSGNFVIAWTDYSPVSDSNVIAHRFDSTGNSVDGEFQVNTYTPYYQTSPVVSMHGSGDFVVAWHGDVLDGSNYGTFAQRFQTCNTPIGHVTDLLVNTSNGGADLVLTWTNTTNADDYVVLEDSTARGLFNTQTGMSATGVTGLTIPTPPDTLIYFLAAGRNASCGIGPKR